MMVFKVMLVLVRLLLGTARVSAKAGYKTAKTGAVTGAKTAVGSARLGYNAGRAVGYGRTAVFAAGVTVGVLAASPKARAGVGRVASAAWGLPQPRVTVTDGRASLEGEAPDAASRRTLAETASEADGVREVDNRIVVAAGADSGSESEGRPMTGMVREDSAVSSPSGNGAEAQSAVDPTADST